MVLDRHDPKDPAILALLPGQGVERFSLTTGRKQLLKSKVTADQKFESWGVLPDGRVLLLTQTGLHQLHEGEVSEVATVAGDMHPIARGASAVTSRQSVSLAHMTVAANGDVLILAYSRGTSDLLHTRLVFRAVEAKKGKWDLSLVAGGGKTDLNDDPVDALSVNLGTVKNVSRKIESFTASSAPISPSLHPIAATSDGGFVLIGNQGLIRAQPSDGSYTIHFFCALGIASGAGGTEGYRASSVYQDDEDNTIVTALSIPQGVAFGEDAQEKRVILKVSERGSRISIIAGGGEESIAAARSGTPARKVDIPRNKPLSWLVPTPGGGLFLRSSNRALMFIGPDKSDDKLHAKVEEALDAFHKHNSGKTNTVIASLQRTRLLALKVGDRLPLATDDAHGKRQTERQKHGLPTPGEPGLAGIREAFHAEVAAAEGKIKAAEVEVAQFEKNLAYVRLLADSDNNKSGVGKGKQCSPKTSRRAASPRTASPTPDHCRTDEEVSLLQSPTATRADENATELSDNDDIIRSEDMEWGGEEAAYDWANMVGSSDSDSIGRSPTKGPTPDQLAFREAELKLAKAELKLSRMKLKALWAGGVPEALLRLPRPIVRLIEASAKVETEWWWAFRATLAKQAILQEVKETTEAGRRVLSSSEDFG